MDKKRKRTIYEIGHNVTKKHWLIYTIITFVPTIWFSVIINYLGNGMQLIKVTGNQKEFTAIGFWLTVIVVIIPLIINAFNNWYASKSETSKMELLQFEKDYNAQLVDSADMVCQKKLESLNGIINSIHNDDSEIPKIVSRPHVQLTTILDEINNCLCVFLSKGNVQFKHRDFIITLAYCFPKDDDQWHWIDGTVERYLPLQDLTSMKSKSTFNYIINENKPFYFNNSKEEANKEGKYCYDENDELNVENGTSAGSIYCCRFQAKSGKDTFVNAIVSISTSQKRFIEMGDLNNFNSLEQYKQRAANARDNITNIVKENFGKRIGIEIRLLYLDYLFNKKIESD